MTYRWIALAILLSTSAMAAEPRPMTATLRKDGTLLVNDKPVLPYGFYISTGHTGDMRLKCVEEVAKIGGNIVHVEGPWPEDTRFLDRATELGIWVVAGHVESEAKLERVKKYRDHTAIIAWTLYDDANTLSTAKHLTKMNKLVKEMAPNRLTFIPLGTQSKIVPMPPAEFFSCSDIVGWEMYPVASPKAADPTLRATETQMAQVAELAQQAQRPYWILPQSFAWPGSRIPTPAEYRNLCYVGLIHGARGVMPWSIYHNVESELRAKLKAAGKPAWEEWYLPDSKELWAECRLVATELKQIQGHLLDGKRTKLTGGEGISAAIWTTKTDSLIVIANLTDKSASAVSLKLPAGSGTELKPVFPERAGKLKLTDNVLSGEVEKAGVQVYWLKNR